MELKLEESKRARELAEEQLRQQREELRQLQERESTAQVGVAENSEDLENSLVELERMGKRCKDEEQLQATDLYHSQLIYTIH